MHLDLKQEHVLVLVARLVELVDSERRLQLLPVSLSYLFGEKKLAGRFDGCALLGSL